MIRPIDQDSQTIISMLVPVHGRLVSPVKLLTLSLVEEVATCSQEEGVACRLAGLGEVQKLVEEEWAP